MGFSQYICIAICKGIYDLVGWGDYVSSSFQWWYYSWFIIYIYFLKFISHLLGWGSGVQWIYKFIPGIFSSFPENSLFDGSPALEGSKFIYVCWVSSMFPILRSYYFLFSFAFFIPPCYWWSSLCLWGCFRDGFLCCSQYSFHQAPMRFFYCILVPHSRCYLDFFLEMCPISSSYTPSLL